MEMNDLMGSTGTAEPEFVLVVDFHMLSISSCYRVSLPLCDGQILCPLWPLCRDGRKKALLLYCGT